MVWSGGDLYGTYFSGDPAWMFGIQWLPLNPGLQFLAQDPVFAQHEFDTMLALRQAQGLPGTIDDMGSGLGNVVLGYEQMVNPDWAAKEMDRLWDANSGIVHANDTGGITYYTTHADRLLGPVAWDYHIDLPCSCVYYNPRTRSASYAAFNPGPADTRATVYKGAARIGTFEAPAGRLTVVKSLSP
jgi:hypothetical protein